MPTPEPTDEDILYTIHNCVTAHLVKDEFGTRAEIEIDDGAPNVLRDLFRTGRAVQAI